MRIVINGKTYPADEPTLWHFIQMERQTGLGVKELQAIYTEQPDSLLGVGITVAAARWSAGEDLTFEEACAIKLSEVQFLKDPGDRKAPAKKAAKKADAPDPQ